MDTLKLIEPFTVTVIQDPPMDRRLTSQEKLAFLDKYKKNLQRLGTSPERIEELLAAARKAPEGHFFEYIGKDGDE